MVEKTQYKIACAFVQTEVFRTGIWRKRCYARLRRGIQAAGISCEPRGLLGIVVSVSNFELGSASSITLRAYFSVVLVIFMFTAAIAFLSALSDSDVTRIDQAVLGFFSRFLGLVVGAAAASQYPIDYPYD